MNFEIGGGGGVFIIDSILGGGGLKLTLSNLSNCVSTAKIFHNVITHNRGTNLVTIMLYYP